jgi:uncharacterized protein
VAGATDLAAADTAMNANTPRTRSSHPVAGRAGVGLKPAHYQAILQTAPRVGFFEIHAENYMGAGGPPHRYLESIRADYPLSIHGVALSIGSSGPLDRAHLDRLQRLVARYEPCLVSEHLAWSTHAGAFLNDLLPLPYTGSTLASVCAHVDEVQQTLRRRILLENPSTYVRFEHSTWSEPEFLAEVARRTGCGLLLDVNNVMVSATNLGWSAHAYIDAFALARVGQIHLAGYAEERGEGEARLLIDDHGSQVHEDVWSLYKYTLRGCGAVPTLIEWDNNLPQLSLLLQQAQRAQEALDERIGKARIPGSAHAARVE